MFSGVAVSAAADMKEFGHLSSVKLMYGSAAASDTSVTYRTNGWCGSNNAAVVVYITDAYGNAVMVLVLVLPHLFLLPHGYNMDIVPDQECTISYVGNIDLNHV